MNQFLIMYVVMETTNIVHEGNSKSLNYFAHLCIKTKILSNCKHGKIVSSFILVTKTKKKPLNNFDVLKVKILFLLLKNPILKYLFYKMGCK